MDTSFTNSRESIAEARRDDTDWSSLTRAEQIRSIELEGYVVIPDLLSQEVRQGMMNEHIKVGRTYPSISQVLLYSTGLADQEFIVGYETSSLAEFQDLVIALRGTEARRYTLSDTPIFTCIHRPLSETLALL